MKSLVKIFLFYLFASFFSVAVLSYVTLTSRINKTEIKFEENFTYTLRFEGLKSPIQQPSLPELVGATVKGQYQTVEPSKEGFAYLYHYIISPTRSGIIRMGEFSIKVENQILKVPGFEVKVVEDLRPSASIPPQTKANVQNEIFLEGRLSKSVCYEGEALIYSLHLLTRESVRNFEFATKPDFDGFRKIELPSSRYPKTSKVEKNGKLFLDAVVFKSVIFPLKSGSNSISPFVADAKVQSASGTTQMVRLKGGEVKVSVLSLPYSIKGFKGCIGNFSAKVSPSGKVSAKVNEIFSIEIEIEGLGSLPAEPFEIPQSPFFENYPPKISDFSEEVEEKFIAKKKIVLSYAPLVEGLRNLPDINLISFDTKKKNFETLVIKLPAIDVKAGVEDKREKKVNIQPPIPEPDKLPPPKKELSTKNILFLFIPFSFTFIIFIFWSFLEKLFLSPEKIRLRTLEQKAFRELKKANSNLDARKSKEFHSHLRKSLEAFIETVIGESVASLTLPEIENKLGNSIIGRDCTLQILSLLQEIDSAQFSSEKVQKTELKKRFLAAKSIIKKKKVDIRVFTFLFLIIFAISLTAGDSDSTDILFKKGFEEQSKGNIEEAIKYYKMAEEYGGCYPALYYNLGNAYLESGKIPYAILYYKKSLKLNPSLLPAQTNLSISLSLLKSKVSPYEISPFDKFLVFLDDNFLYYTALFLIIAGNLIFSFLKISGSLNKRVFLTRLSTILMISGLFVSFICYKSILAKSEFSEAVILEKSEVFEKPDPSTKPKTVLPEGSVVYVSKNSSLWTKVKWGEGEGYVYSSKLGVP